MGLSGGKKNSLCNYMFHGTIRDYKFIKYEISIACEKISRENGKHREKRQ